MILITAADNGHKRRQAAAEYYKEETEYEDDSQRTHQHVLSNVYLPGM